MKMSIGETLEYFGRIYGMKNSEISRRIDFLKSFLDLPSLSRHLEILSGGQQRRVSLAVCLLHEPSLLILDEPTVGVDPLLRERIWEYLCELVEKKNTTVIITTHYIEEARQSHKIGLMRGGRLLTEKPPDLLLQEYGSIFLEDIVVQLCKKDNNEVDEIALALHDASFYSGTRARTFSASNNVRGLTFKRRGSIPEDTYQYSFRESIEVEQPRKETLASKGRQKLSRIRALTIRNVLSLWRNPIVLVFIFILPSFDILLSYNLVGHVPKNFKFGVINPEINYDLDQCNTTYTTFQKCSANLGCSYLNTLPESVIKPIGMKSVEEALDNVRAGTTWGYIRFPQNFSQHLTDRALTGNFAENETLESSTIQFRMDMSRYFSSRLLMKSFYESFAKFAKNMLEICGQDSSKADIPLRFKKPVYGSYDGPYQHFVTPAVLITITFFLPAFTGCFAILIDRKNGTLDRSMVAGITRMELIFSLFITEGVAIVLQSIVSYCCALYVFEGTFEGSHLAFIMVIICTGVAGLCFGFLLAQLYDEEFEALLVIVGLFVFQLPLTGLVWPLEGANKIMGTIAAYCIPVNWAITAARSIVSRGWPITHPKVWPSFAALFLWVIVTWLLTMTMWRKKS